MTKTPACERYLEDPEANAEHLAACEECAALFGSGTLDFVPAPVALDALPLAPWEGARHRPWPLVIGGVLALVAAAAALFVAAGISPAPGVVQALASSIPPARLLVMLRYLIADGVQHAPAAFRIAIGISFIVINTLLVVLLRRAPKGLDLDA